MVESRQKVLKDERARTSDEEVARVAEEARADADGKKVAAETAEGELRKVDSEGVRVPRPERRRSCAQGQERVGNYPDIADGIRDACRDRRE